jgi:outer membrane protein
MIARSSAISRRRLLPASRAIVGWLLLSTSVSYAQIDPFETRSGLDVAPGLALNPATGQKNLCANAAPVMRMSLYDAVTRALCTNPKVQRSWANMLLNAGQVGVALSAYLPSIAATASQQRATDAFRVSEPSQLDTTSRTSTRDASISLSWVLFDFGQRSSNLKYYQRLLNLAKATHDDALQALFEQTAELFYTVWAGESALAATEEAETIASRSYQIAVRKHSAGTGTLNDELQAQTASRQAIFDRVNATGNLKAAMGELAVTMGLPIDTRIEVDVNAGIQPDLHFTQSIADLMRLAQEVNPKLHAATALLEADQANAEFAKRQELPTVALVGSLTNTSQLGALPHDQRTNQRVIGIQVSIPMFSGFEQEYHRQASDAQVNIDRADLRNAELQVATSVWKSYQDVMTRTESLNLADAVAGSAQEAFDVAEKRYAAGVGSMLDLLTAQVALARAKRQIVQSQSDWRTSRLALALSIGTLDSWDTVHQAEAP